MKKIIYIFILCMISIFLISCGKRQTSSTTKSAETTQQPEDQTEEQTDFVDHELEQQEQLADNSYLSTDYHIEDYENGYLIISKSDGLLFGVIDRNNNTIIPVEYDEISFVNSNGNTDKQYFCAKYENQYTLFDEQSTKLIENSNYPIDSVKYETKTSDNMPLLFYTKATSEQALDFSELIFYNENGSIRSNIKLENGNSSKPLLLSEEYVNENFFIMTITAFQSTNPNATLTYMYDYDGKVLKKWKKSSISHCNTRGDSENDYYVYIQNLGAGKVDKVYIDSNGNCKSIDHYTGNEIQNEYIENQQQASPQTDVHYVGPNNENVIYKSNDTWKYESKTGTPIYDTRYYSCKSFDKSYLLSNENNDVCVITQNGKKVIDYGSITYDGDENYSYNGTTLDSYNNFFSDNSSVCIVTKEDGLEEAHFFSESE
ncbi:MAG: WG repeat-containing protein [Eubacterium sp.]|nr:WG repeat-containing protein [Eubacterium sp.]